MIPFPDIGIKPYFQTESLLLFHGDCLKILKAIPPKSVDLIFTDPPYGHNNNNGDLIANWEAALGKKTATKPEWRPIANDGLEANNIFKSGLPEWLRLLRSGGCCCCCCGGGGPDPQFARWSLWLDEVFDFKQMVVWDKGPMGMGWHYRRSYETVLVGTKPGASCKWYDDTQKIENVIRPGKFGIRKIIPSQDEHPTEKPWQLSAFFINLHTLKNEIVLDPFMGCGSTAIACLHTGRMFVGIELEESFLQQAKQKIQNEMKQLKFTF